MNDSCFSGLKEYLRDENRKVPKVYALSLFRTFICRKAFYQNIQVYLNLNLKFTKYGLHIDQNGVSLATWKTVLIQFTNDFDHYRGVASTHIPDRES